MLLGGPANGVDDDRQARTGIEICDPPHARGHRRPCIVRHGRPPPERRQLSFAAGRGDRQSLIVVHAREWLRCNLRLPSRSLCPRGCPTRSEKSASANSKQDCTCARRPVVRRRVEPITRHALMLTRRCHRAVQPGCQHSRWQELWPQCLDQLRPGTFWLVSAPCLQRLRMDTAHKPASCARPSHHHVVRRPTRNDNYGHGHLPPLVTVDVPDGSRSRRAATRHHPRSTQPVTGPRVLSRCRALVGVLHHWPLLVRDVDYPLRRMAELVGADRAARGNCRRAGCLRHCCWTTVGVEVALGVSRATLPATGSDWPSARDGPVARPGPTMAAPIRAIATTCIRIIVLRSEIQGCRQEKGTRRQEARVQLGVGAQALVLERQVLVEQIVDAQSDRAVPARQAVAEPRSTRTPQSFSFSDAPSLGPFSISCCQNARAAESVEPRRDGTTRPSAARSVSAHHRDRRR